jgi:hypothetical protein
MKALVDKMNQEKPPFLQNIIKKVSTVIRCAHKNEIRPFLDHLTDIFLKVK